MKFSLIRRCVLFVLLSALVSACRIQVSTSAGGSIQTASGSYFCEADAECSAVEVTDTNFDETFIAVPDSGFKFAGWRSRNRGLCGGFNSNIVRKAREVDSLRPVLQAMTPCSPSLKVMRSFSWRRCLSSDRLSSAATTHDERCWPISEKKSSSQRCETSKHEPSRCKRPPQHSRPAHRRL